MGLGIKHQWYIFRQSSLFSTVSTLFLSTWRVSIDGKQSHLYNNSTYWQLWRYQVISQLGVFITRSSVSLVQLPVCILILLPFLQITNAVGFIYNAFAHYIPHLWVAFCMMLAQGLIAGASYVNTLYRIHKEVNISLSISSISMYRFTQTLKSSVWP